MVACFVVVQSLSVRCFVTPWIAACQAYLSFTVSWNLLKFKSIVLMMPSYHFILYCPLPLLPSMFLSIRVFYNGSAFHFRWPKCWSLRIRPSSEYSGLISFGIDWFDLLAVQEIIKSSPITVQKHQFFCALPSLWSKSHIHTQLLKKLQL